MIYQKKQVQSKDLSVTQTQSESVPASVPAVLQVRKENTATENRKDLRPAVFIKDLKKRSNALEEEKAQHHQKMKKQVSSQSGGSKSHGSNIEALSNSHLKKLQKAIDSQNLKFLSDTIYEIKLNEEVSKSLQKKIIEAEQVLIKLSP